MRRRETEDTDTSSTSRGKEAAGEQATAGTRRGKGADSGRGAGNRRHD